MLERIKLMLCIDIFLSPENASLALGDELFFSIMAALGLPRELNAISVQSGRVSKGLDVRQRSWRAVGYQSRGNCTENREARPKKINDS